jgi:hypothetical protein
MGDPIADRFVRDTEAVSCDTACIWNRFTTCSWRSRLRSSCSCGSIDETTPIEWIRRVCATLFVPGAKLTRRAIPEVAEETLSSVPT